MFAASIRTRPEDFEVTEVLGWDLSGDGEHDYLWIEKTGANTEWVARQLARHADVPAKDVGYAGLKDRHAVTTQWFSVPRWHAPDWSSLDVEGVLVLDTGRHSKKLRRGAHKGNAFRIVLRGADIAGHADALAERVQEIGEGGVPNYFGEQRFGRGGGNLRLADDWAAGRRLPRHKRGMAISTIRSFLFNEALSLRVSDGSWNRIRPGDTVNLDGTGSVFVADAVDADLERRCAGMDVHPAGILAGQGCGAGPETWRAALDKARVEPGARSLRLHVSDLEYALEDEAVELRFTLGRGAFATSVLREIANADS
ncbi:MAG: tRNA pseudouridine(13) synthase TruD [Gammaproteobacteria bacterium]|nr:tRNA pseudouridine(13) synthase TruD [Gammaproteobacteria bacterium]NNF50243.1 tRNA pseudouridine(13) synthase TruD [Woeseiaceae bacterium]MBT8094688.1 tRNA pseudouridine(13) synthase TruD [Gammaproteobacteria bacterium]MBT8105419.1 tRNA pseudouridine(13) synthase TruD [Gammaproteobacteria bacterium]NNK25433.1 tRNA pseudouridine(13) synthase TruD [Woeseiaceae bacterium]